MITCKQFPGKTFNSKEELFAELRINVNKIIACKTAETYKSFEKGSINIPTGFLIKQSGEAEKVGPQMKDNCIYPVINTTKYLDSHGDVHLDGIWDTSAKQQQGKLYYVCDHEIKTNTIIAWPQDVSVMVKSVPWSWVGKDYTGNTEALIYEIDKNNIVNADAKKIIDEKRPVQNSVRMQYVKINLGMNSTAKEDIQYKAYWDKHIESIANKDVAEAQGFFFGVEEAKIVREGSMVPLGSNDATPIRQKDTVADTITTEKIEPENPSTQANVTKFINPNLF